MRSLGLWIVGLVLFGNLSSAIELVSWSRMTSEAGHSIQFTLVCERNAEYLIQRSTNLQDWETVLRSFGPTTQRVLSIPSQSTPAQAFFRAQRTNEPFALLSKMPLELEGSTFVDSFDSTHTNYSTQGLYDYAKRMDRALVGCNSSLQPAISGGGDIYGSAMIGAGGSVSNTSIGGGAWLAFNQGIQPGHLRNDFNAAFAEVSLPAPWSPMTPGPGAAGGTNYSYVLTAGDYELPTLVQSNTIFVAGPSRLLISSNLVLSRPNAIVLAREASLELYLGGQAIILQADINRTGTASQCRLFGLPGCTNISISSWTTFIGSIYAPQANLRLSGGGEFSGALMANSFQISANQAIHCDEALGR